MKHSTHGGATKALLLTTSLTALSAVAVDYTWEKGRTTGIWCSSASWGVESGYPGTADTDKANFTSWTLGVAATLDADVTFHTLKFSNGYGGTIDLGGHSMTLTKGNGATEGLFISIEGKPTAVGSLSPKYAVVFTNGTFNLGKTSEALRASLGPSGNSSTLIVTDAILNGGFSEWWGSSRLMLKNGAVWTPDMNQRVGNGYYRKDELSAYSLLCVQGDGTRIDSADYDLNIRSYKNQFYLQDGAVATFKDLLIGGTFRSTNCLASVENALLTVNGTLHLGSDAINPSGAAGQFLSDVNLSRESTLHIEGANALVTVGTLAVYAKTAAALEIVLPKTGFVDAGGDLRAPISVGTLSLVARNAAYEDMGPTRFSVTSRDWCNRHSETTVTLLSFTTADEAAVNELLDNVVLADYTPAEIAAGQAPIVALGEDGKSIALTSPFAQVNPTFEACAESGTTVGTKTIRVTPASYGTVSSSITSILVEWADNPSFAGAKSVEMLAEPLTDALPQTLRQNIVDGFVAHERYYARVTVTTEEALSSVKTFWFDGDDGVSEKYAWLPAGGTTACWQDPASWSKTDERDWPRGEDDIKFGYFAGTRTITLAEDAEARSFQDCTSGKYPAVAYGTDVFELNGHTLRLTATYNKVNLGLSIGGDGTAKDDLEPVGPTVVFRNGRFEMPDPQIPYTIPSSVLIGPITTTGSGTLVLDDGAAMVADIRYLSNSSRLLVKNGSSWRPVTLGLTICNHTARSPYAAICVTGDCSRIDFTGFSLTVRGDRAGLYVLDGGRVDATTLNLGVNDAAADTASSVASERTTIRVADGTVAVAGDFEIGWQSDKPLNPRLELAGSNATVTVAGSLKLHEKIGAVLSFELSEDGFAATPLQAGSLEFVTREAGLIDYGAPTLAFKGVKAWAKKHPKATVDLVSLTTPNASALETLKANVQSDWRQVDSSALAVSADGRKLMLTAPEIPGLLMIVR